MDSMKRQKGMTWEDESPRLKGVQYAIGGKQRAITNSSRKNEMAGPKEEPCFLHFPWVSQFWGAQIVYF